MRVSHQPKRAVQFVGAGEGNIQRRDAELLGGLLGRTPLRLFARMIGVRQNRELAQIRKDLLEQFNPLARQFERQEGRAGEITAGLAEALDQAQFHGVAAQREQDRHFRDRRHRARRRPARYRQVDLAAPEFGCHLAQRLRIADRIMQFKDDVLALDVAPRAQSLPEPFQERDRAVTGSRASKCDKLCVESAAKAAAGQAIAAPINEMKSRRFMRRNMAQTSFPGLKPVFR